MTLTSTMRKRRGTIRGREWKGETHADTYNYGDMLTMAKQVKSPFDRDGGRRFTELEIPDRKLIKEQKKIADKLTRLLNEHRKKKKNK